MAAIKVKQVTVNNLTVEGDLTFATINKHSPKMMQQLFKTNDLTIDLNKVNASDSAGLALIIEWLKIAQSRKIQLSFVNVPEQLLTIASLSAFDSVFQSTH